MNYTPVHFLEFTNGGYTDVPIINVPQNALYIQDNCVTSYKLGAILKRTGYSYIGAGTLQTGKTITGLHNFRQSASTQKILATIDDSTSDDTQLFYSTGGNWTEITDAETAWANKAGINVEMEDFIGYCFFVGYGATDGFLPVASLTGTTFSTSANVTSMPQAKYITRYRDKLFIGNCYITATAYPYRVYFSSLPSAGAITWTQATDWFDIDYSEEIKGISSNWDLLAVFTEYSTFFYNETSLYKAFDVGCSNHRTIKNAGAYMIWANMDGVWISTGGRPQNIAGRVIDFIRYANMTNAFAEVVDEEYHLYVGNVTVNGVSYGNTDLIYNIPTGTWRWHEYGHAMSIFARAYSDGEDFLLSGTSAVTGSGKVYQMGKFTDTTLLKTDDTLPIHSWFQTGALRLGDPSMSKSLGKIVAYADRAQGLQLKARVVDRNSLAVTHFKPLMTLTGFITEKQVNPDKGNFLQIEGVENGSSEYWSFFGFTSMVGIDKTLKP